MLKIIDCTKEETVEACKQIQTKINRMMTAQNHYLNGIYNEQEFLNVVNLHNKNIETILEKTLKEKKEDDHAKNLDQFLTYPENEKGG